MHIGTLVTLRSGGILIDSARMEALGIGDNSVCWGDWFYPDEYFAPSSEQKGETSNKTKDRRDAHLFVTPYPPRTWPALLRLEVLLQHKPGSFHALTDYLSRCNFNIVSTQSVQAGHNHAVCTLVLDASRVLAQPLLEVDQERRKHNPNIASDALALPPVRNFAATVLRHCVEVESGLRHELSQFLWNNTFAARLELTPKNIDDRRSRLGRKSRRDLYRVICSSFPQQISCSWMQFYFYAWLLQQNFDSTLVFRYNAKTRALESRSNIGVPPITSVLPVTEDTLPIRGLASIDRRNNVAKFIFSDFLDPRRSAPRECRIEYEASIFPSAARQSAKSGDAPAPAEGLLAHITSTFADNSSQLLWVQNRITDLSTGSSGHTMWEKGEVIIAVQGNHFAAGAPYAQGDFSTSASEDFTIATSLSTRFNCNPIIKSRLLRPWHVFVSTHTDWFTSSHHEDLRTRLREHAARLGMKLTHVDFRDMADYQTREVLKLDNMYITNRVQSTLSSCDCMLQILPRDFLSKHDTNRMRWMFFERGFATAAGLPIAVCVEVDPNPQYGIRREEWESQLQITAGEFLFLFELRQDSPNVASDISKAIDALYNKLMCDHHE